MAVKLLVTGSTGQLGQEFCNYRSNKFEIIGVSRIDADITDLVQIRKAIRKHNPDIVIHTAAMTDVDACEVNPEVCHKINADGAANVAKAAELTGSKLIYISTDYVFDGEKERPYRESDTPNPTSIYGRTKLNGEGAVQNYSDNWVVIRTSWVYSQYRNNFVKAIIKQFKSGQTIKVVNDQFGSPTWTKDIVMQTLKIIDTKQTGLFHVASKGSVSRYEMTRLILDKLKIKAKIVPVSTVENERSAKRPARSELASERLGRLGIDIMRPYNEALNEFLDLHGETLLNEI